MTKRKLAAVILAAGQGTRMKSDLPKVLHPLAGRAMVHYVLDAARALDAERMVVVVGPDMPAVTSAVAPVPTVVQARPLGTADAAMAARDTLDGFEGDVLVLFGDAALIRAETVAAMLSARAGSGAAVTVLGMRPEDPTPYGRLVTGTDGALEAVVESRDATPAQQAIRLCNSGVMLVDGALLFDMLAEVGNANAKGEYYLTDLVAIARSLGRACAVVEGDATELVGINTRAELAVAEAAMQHRLRLAAMNGGATLADPASTYFSFDTQLGRDVTVGPNVVFGPGVVVGDRVEIKAFCHIEEATIADDAVVGPFARLRPGAAIGDGARIGNFVEVKNANIESGAKVNHLTYIGDARVGAGANVGAGTITCNYDGFAKNRTDIGAGAFIGSNVALVAPVRIGDGAFVGAGSTVTRDVPADALALTRAEYKEVSGWANRVKNRKAADAADKD